MVLLAFTLQSYIIRCSTDKLKKKSQPSLVTNLKASFLQSERQLMDGNRHTNIPQYHIPGNKVTATSARSQNFHKIMCFRNTDQ